MAAQRRKAGARPRLPDEVIYKINCITGTKQVKEKFQKHAAAGAAGQQAA